MKLLILTSMIILILITGTESQQRDDCQEICGNTSIPYPFGIGDGCFLNTNFSLTCNDTVNPPILMWYGYPVQNISVDEAEMRVSTFIASYCYSSNGTFSRSSYSSRSTTYPNFPFSYTKNRLFALGCDTSAMIRDGEQMTGCMSFCSDESRLINLNGTCSGIGCCQSTIPRGFVSLNITLESFNNHINVSYFNPCSIAFLAPSDFYTFSISDLGHQNLSGSRTVPSIMDWSVGNQTCEEARTTLSYVCGSNSNCTDSDNGLRYGYECHCSLGYRGNPYLQLGCQDVNECLDSSHRCVNISRCVNTLGNYTCSCPVGYTGDGRNDGEGCGDIDECNDPNYPNRCDGQCINTDGSFSCSPNHLLAIKISVGVGVSVVVVIAGITFLYWIQRKRKHIKLKEKFFERNGGFLLQQLVERKDLSSNMIKIFTAEELLTATKNYNDSLIAGRGGYGTVYKGTLPDGTFVAIKKPKQTDIISIDDEEIKQFISEVVILGQVNNRNIVHLRGCCLETPSPILVYEFVTNGTLFEHLHKSKVKLPWDIRLKIATRTAEVLSYLHSQAVIPIIHRDIKSTNILLDEDLNPKVSDFGASRLVASDEMQICTMVQGTLGYLDPEYLQTSQLTDKSDVYSFGVLLVEILTGQKAVRSDTSEKEKSLAKYFLSALKENRLDLVIEYRVLQEASIELLQKVAEIARGCLSLNGEERPSMKQVAMELEGLENLGLGKHSSSHRVSEQIHSEEEHVYLLGEGADEKYSDQSINTSTYDTIRNQVVITIPTDGR